MNIQYVRGDATLPYGDGPRIITNVCHEIGAWGKGFVMALSSRSPKPEMAYREWYQNRDINDFELGAVQLVSIEPDLWVANMIGQRGIRSRNRECVPPIRYPAIETALQKVAEHAAELHASIHMPRIGCGLAGGKWVNIEKLIQEQLIGRGLSVTVYDLP